MPIAVQALDKSQAARVLAQEEGHFLDLKSCDIKPAAITKSLSAFANTDGGDLYVGVDEDKLGNIRHWRGFPNQEAANGLLQTIESLFPIGDAVACEFLSCPEQSGYMLHITIHKTVDIKQASNGRAYVRRGAQNLPVEARDALERLQRNKGISSFETQTVDANIDVITNSETIIRFVLSIVPTAEPEMWLRKQQLIRDSKPTVAAVVLFADEPQAVLPKRSGVKIYRYRTSGNEGVRESLADDPLTIEGCAYDQIRAAVAEATRIIAAIPALGTAGLQSVSYPPETLHEIVTNAIIHRDYSIADDVHIRIFDNRVEVESPGTLPGHVTVVNILQERFARNGSVVRILNKFPNPPNKDIGEGLNTAFEAMRKLRLKPPIIKADEGSVSVIIRHEQLASPEDIVMEYLGAHDAITNATARELCAIQSENAVKSVFYRLRDRNMIERVPGLGGAKAAWRLCPNDTV